MRAGFVLAGGRSSRMGRDKALLRAGPRTMLETTADLVRQAAGSVVIIGPPERYAHLGFAILPDARPSPDIGPPPEAPAVGQSPEAPHVEPSPQVELAQGPLSGVYTALSVTPAEWNLVVACDMPGLTVDFLKALLDAAELAGRDCLAPVTRRGIEPLCAVYHRRAASAAARALHAKLLRMQDFVRSLNAAEFPVSDSAILRNINTPEEAAADARLGSPPC